MKWIIHAMEDRYGGLHGIEEWLMAEGDENLIKEYAIEASYEVMDSYTFQEQLDDAEDFYEDHGEEGGVEVGDILEDIRQEEVDFNYWKIKEDCPFSFVDINRILCQDPEGFVDEWCEQV